MVLVISDAIILSEHASVWDCSIFKWLVILQKDNEHLVFVTLSLLLFRVPSAITHFLTFFFWYQLDRDWVICMFDLSLITKWCFKNCWLIRRAIRWSERLYHLYALEIHFSEINSMEPVCCSLSLSLPLSLFPQLYTNIESSSAIRHNSISIREKKGKGKERPQNSSVIILSSAFLRLNSTDLNWDWLPCKWPIKRTLWISLIYECPSAVKPVPFPSRKKQYVSIWACFRFENP